MKKIITLIFLFLCLSFFFACNKDTTDCSTYQITEAEKSFIPYTKGQIVVFKNDTTGIKDTLSVSQLDNYPKGSNNTTCGLTIIGIGAEINFSAIDKSSDNITLNVYHNQTPYASIAGSHFNLSGSFQTKTINSITYTDVYTVSIDSNGLNSIYPWKIDYSRSKGFVRFYMKKGITWSKL